MVNSFFLPLIHPLAADTYHDDREMHYKDSEFSRQKLLDEFKRSHNIVDVLFKELTDYKAEVRFKVMKTF